jgi:hypothetical protein
MDAMTLTLGQCLPPATVSPNLAFADAGLGTTARKVRCGNSCGMSLLTTLRRRSRSTSLRNSLAARQRPVARLIGREQVGVIVIADFGYGAHARSAMAIIDMYCPTAHDAGRVRISAGHPI